jgi:hypothetical protein
MKTSVEEIPEELWQVACAREAVIRPLAAAPRVGRLEIEAAATALGIQPRLWPPSWRARASHHLRPQISLTRTPET